MNIFKQLKAELEYQGWRTAVHESGHVFASWCVDKRLAGGVMCLSDEGQARVSGSAASAVAGVVALEVIGDADPERGASDDLAYLASLPVWEQAEGRRLAREALTKYRPSLERFAQLLLSNDGRLSRPEVKAALIAAFQFQDGQITAALEGRTLIVDDSDYEFHLMVRQRSIAEALHDAFPRRSFAKLSERADELAARNVKPEHAAEALRHLEAERSAGIVRVMPPAKLIERKRQIRGK